MSGTPYVAEIVNGIPYAPDDAAAWRRIAERFANLADRPRDERLQVFPFALCAAVGATVWSAHQQYRMDRQLQAYLQEQVYAFPMWAGDAGKLENLLLHDHERALVALWLAEDADDAMRTFGFTTTTEEL